MPRGEPLTRPGTWQKYNGIKSQISCCWFILFALKKKKKSCNVSRIQSRHTIPPKLFNIKHPRAFFHAHICRSLFFFFHVLTYDALTSGRVPRNKFCLSMQLFWNCKKKKSNTGIRVKTVWTQQCSLSRQPCFPLKTELWLMDLCLPEESGVVFLRWIMGRDWEPLSIYQLISGH